MLKHKILWWVVCIVLAGVYFLLKFQGPSWVQWAYDNNHVNFLNIITSTDKGAYQVLDYYQGRMEQALLGPLDMLFSGSILIILTLMYCKKMKFLNFALVILIYFLATRPEVLFYPPYGDTIGGPFAEAIWLYQNHFDYVGLSQQPNYIEGGPKVYLFSIYPSFLAVLMYLIPSVKAFLALNHLIVFIMSSLIIAFFRNILLKVFSETTALLTSLLLLAFPLFQSQVEAINMEIPVVFFSMLAIHYLVNKRVGMATLIAIIATWVKGVAILICAVIILISLGMFFWDDKLKFKKRLWIWAILNSAFIAFMLYLSIFVLNRGQDVPMVGTFAGWKSIRVMEVFYSYLISLAILIFFIIKETLEKGKNEFGHIWNKYFVPIVLFCAVLTWFGLFLNHYALSPRYRLLLAPFTTFSIIFAISLVIKREKIIEGFLVVITLISFICGYGLFQKPIADSNHVLIERSLEYRIDLKFYMKVAKYMEKYFSDYLIGAPFLVAQTLAIPQLGYVTKNLNIMMYEMVSNYGNIKNFTGLRDINIGETIWVGLKREDYFGTDYPVAPGDKVIKMIYYGNGEATLFVGGLAIEKARLMVEYIIKKGIFKRPHP